jgi:F-type H+-transporting ATPase subunit gamma
MASAKAIRRRLATVKNTQKITKAMKLVSAAKLRRAQQAAESTRPFAESINEIIGRIAARVDTKIHPLLKPREVKTVNLVVVTSDRGLAGAYNGNVLRKAEQYIKAAEREGKTVKVTAIGKRSRDNRFLRKYLLDFITDIGTGLSYGTAELLSERLVPRFLASEPVDVDGDGVADVKRWELEAPAIEGEGETKKAEVVPVDSVVVIYTQFKSALTQMVVTKQILPMEPIAISGEEARIDYKYEPGQKEMLEALLPRHLKMQLFRALLESTASEHGARMTAMDNASKNAADMIERLTLQMNRARQAVITKELMEIVSGKEALEG